MATKGLVLRQHLRDGSQKIASMLLSLDDQPLIYSLCTEASFAAPKIGLPTSPDPDAPIVLFEGEDMERASVIFHTRDGFICIEALSEVYVQATEGDYFNGHNCTARKLQRSQPPGRRIFTQLAPGMSIYVGTITISIVLDQAVPSAKGPGHESLDKQKSLNAIDETQDEESHDPNNRPCPDQRLDQMTAGEDATLVDPNQAAPPLNGDAETQDSLLSIIRVNDGTIEESTDVQSPPHPASMPEPYHSTDNTNEITNETAPKTAAHSQNKAAKLKRPYEDTAGAEPQPKRSRFAAGAITPSPTNSERSSPSRTPLKIGRRSPKKIVLASSTSINQSKSSKFFKNHDIRVVNAVADCDVFCIGAHGVIKSAKFLTAVLYGKKIVFEEWILASQQQGLLLEEDLYLARDERKEAEWGVSLPDAIARGKTGSSKPFTGYRILVSPTAKRELGKSATDDLRSLSILAGATSFTCTLPTKANDKVTTIIIIGKGRDQALPELRHWQCHSHDIISLSILQGRLDRGKCVVKEPSETAGIGQETGDEPGEQRGTPGALAYDA